MIESVLQRVRCSFFEKVTIKSLIAVGIVALSVLLPQLVHVLAGPSGGMTWMRCICLFCLAVACWAGRGGWVSGSCRQFAVF